MYMCACGCVYIYMGESTCVHAKEGRLKLRKPTTPKASALLDIRYKLPSL